MYADGNFPRYGILAKGILNPNPIIHFTAKRIDLNLALIKYPMFFFHERMNLALDRLMRIAALKLDPILKSRIVCSLQVEIMSLLLIKEKFDRFLDSKLSKKARLTLVTIFFGVSFTVVCLFSYTNFPKKPALVSLQNRHRSFRKYAFLDVTQDKYIKSLIILNTGLYLVQSGCLLGLFTPGVELKHQLNTATVISTGALLSQVKVHEKITKSKWGPLLKTLAKPEVSLPLSTLFGLGFHSSFKPIPESAVKYISTEMFLNEVQLWKKIRTGILNLPDDVRQNLSFKVGDFYYREDFYASLVDACQSLITRSAERVPLFQNKKLQCIHQASLQFCKQVPCSSISKEAFSLMQNLIERGFLEKKLLSVGGTHNLYREADVTAISLINLLMSTNNLYSKTDEVLTIGEITGNLELWSWLRTLKFLSDNHEL